MCNDGEMTRVVLALVLAGGCGSSPGSSAETGSTSSSTTTGDAVDASSSATSVDATSGTATTGLDATSEGGTETSTGDVPVEPWVWDLPEGFPEPYVPQDNPMSAAKVELGRHLFYDTRMSGSGTYACATCHLQELAFTDGVAHAVGETGEVHRRNSMSLTNVAYNASLTWAHPLLLELERQALVPMFGDDPIELGLDSEDELVAALATEPLYDPLFAAAFPGDPSPLTGEHVVQALSSFQRTMISGRSPFDRWFYEGDATAISEEAVRGYELFNGHPFECFHCHVGFNVTDAVYYDGLETHALVFHNTGLYNVDGIGGYPPEDAGLVELTLDPEDMGKFRAPSLRNIAVTAPYMHDGSIATLDEVLAHYAAGGRTIAEGPHAGVGSENPFKDPLLAGFEMTNKQRDEVIAFLESLTDDEFLTDPALSDPWTGR
jgi:cytochrome c peroxidase